MGMNGVERKELGNKRVLESTGECLSVWKERWEGGKLALTSVGMN